MASPEKHNYINAGDKVCFVAGVDLEAGDGVMVGGNIPAIIELDALTGHETVAKRSGRFWIPKDTAEALSQGERLWLDVADGRKGKKTGITGKVVFAFVAKDALIADTTVEIFLAPPGIVA